MNHLQKKKIAFMSIVNSVKGFVRTITGSLPLTLEGCVDEESITDYKLYGQSVQDGTPTPDTPIEVESVGEKTKNLFNYADYTTLTNYNGNDISANWLTIDGDLFYIKHDYYNGGCWLTPTKQWGLLAGTYTLSGKCKDNSIKGNPLICYCGIRWSDDTRNAGWGKPNSNDGEWYNFSYTFTITEDKTVKGIYLQDNGATAKSSICFTNIQLEEGSTATEYEPYGYKIPIKVSGNDKTITTNIYLDEPLRKVGDYADYIKSVDLVNGTGVVVRRVTKVLNALPKVNIITQKNPNTIMVGCHGMFCKGNTLIYSPIFKNGRPELVWGNDSELIMSHIAENTNDFAYFKLKYDRLNLALGDDRTTVYNVDDESKTALTNSQIFATINDYLTLNFTEEELSIYVCDYRSPTETPITLPPIPTFKGTNIISTDTTIQPSNAEVTYYSNVKE